MSLSSQVLKITTYQSIQAEYNKAVVSMQNAKSCFDYLTEQVSAMQISGVFTVDEIAEIQEMKESIVGMAKSLLPSE